MAPDRDTLLRWAVRHRVRADELRMKGKDRLAENNDEISAHYEALAAAGSEAA